MRFIDNKDIIEIEHKCVNCKKIYAFNKRDINEENRISFVNCPACNKIRVVEFNEFIEARRYRCIY